MRMETNKFFKKMIKRHHITARRAGEMCGRTESMVSWYVSGKRTMPLKILEMFMCNLQNYVDNQAMFFANDLVEFNKIKEGKSGK